MEEPLILDRYRPLAHLGAGGHGSVVLAFDTKMARRVAIKRLPLPRSRSGSVVPRTGLAEARTAAMLNHPNIVIVHEWDTDSDEAFIVMEDIDGASVADLLDAFAEPLDADEAAAVLEAVTAALGFAHANGVLHLDLKPANILITRDGRVKVADFGVSALTDASGTASGTAGTIGYMAPEQLRGEPLDERADVWALAAVLYEVLTNANPFDADTAEGSLFKIEVAEVPLPSEFEPTLAEPLEDALFAGLAADADERSASVGELGAAAAPYLGDPALGREKLAERIEEVLGEAGEAAGGYGPLGLWDRLGRFGRTLSRAAAAIVGGWLGWAGAAAMIASPSARFAAGGLVALAAALAPSLGLALGGAIFSIAVGIDAGIPAGIVTAALFAALWLSIGRRGSGAAFVPAVGPLLATVRAALAAPLLAGFSLPPLQAALTSAFAAVVLIAVSAGTDGSAPFLVTGTAWLADPWGAGIAPAQFLHAIAEPGLIAVVVAWAAAGALCSLGCRRSSRAGAMMGVAGGTLALVLGYAAWTAVARAPFTISPIDVGASALLVGLTIALGPPARAEEE